MGHSWKIEINRPKWNDFDDKSILECVKNFLI